LFPNASAICNPQKLPVPRRKQAWRPAGPEAPAGCDHGARAGAVGIPGADWIAIGRGNVVHYRGVDGHPPTMQGTASGRFCRKGGR
jgi:hypothetical protein